MVRIPVATYRLQLHADFGFDAAAEAADLRWESQQRIERPAIQETDEAHLQQKAERRNRQERNRDRQEQGEECEATESFLNHDRRSRRVVIR